MKSNIKTAIARLSWPSRDMMDVCFVALEERFLLPLNKRAQYEPPPIADYNLICAILWVVASYYQDRPKTVLLVICLSALIFGFQIVRLFM